MHPRIYNVKLMVCTLSLGFIIYGPTVKNLLRLTWVLTCSSSPVFIASVVIFSSSRTPMFLITPCSGKGFPEVDRLIEARESHSHNIYRDVSSSVPNFL